MPFKSKAQQRYMYSQHPKIAKEFSKKTKDFKSLPEHAESSASTGALFKEDIPGPMRITTADTFINKNIDPKKEKGLGLETSAEEDTLMGRLAKRMAARDYIDNLDLGTKTAKQVKEARETSDIDMPRAMQIGGEIEKEHNNTVKGIISGKISAKDAPKAIAKDHTNELGPNYYDPQKGLPEMEKRLGSAEEKNNKNNKINNQIKATADGFGQHIQIKDQKAINFSDPAANNTVLPGNTMAEQARKAGKIVGKGYNIIGNPY